MKSLGFVRKIICAVVLLSLVSGDAAIGANAAKVASRAPHQRVRAKNCFELINELRAQIGTVGAHAQLDKADEASTAKIGEPVDGRHGGKRLTVRRTGSQWMSNYTSKFGVDPQGDPRWFIEAVGPEAARFFGFEVVDDSTILVPDAIEFNNALIKLNARLKALGQEQVAVSYYGQGPKALLSIYLRLFGNGLGLPIAGTENHYLHDISFHTGAIFLPIQLMRYMSGRARFIEKLALGLEAIEVSEAKKVEMATAIKRFREDEAQRVDVATSVLPLIAEAHEKAIAQGKSISLLDRTLGLLPYIIGMGQGRASDSLRELIKLKVPPEFAKQAEVILDRTLAEFAALSVEKGGFSPTGTFEEAFGVVNTSPKTVLRFLRKLCVESTRRREEIGAVARDLLAEMQANSVQSR